MNGVLCGTKDEDDVKIIKQRKYYEGTLALVHGICITGWSDVKQTQ
jgi:hypothetical protein